MKRILITAVAYALLLTSVNILMDIGLLEVRLGAFLPPLAGMVWGVEGALGAALGNIVRDVCVGDDPAAIPIGAVANFLYAYVPYRLWLLTTEKRKYFLPNTESLVRYFFVLAIGAAVGTIFLITGVTAVGYEIPDYFMYQVFISNFDFPFLFTPAIMILLASSGYLFPRKGGAIKRKFLPNEVKRPLNAQITFILLVGGSIFIILVSAFFTLHEFLNGNYNIIKIFQSIYSYHYLTLHLFFVILLGILWLVEKRLVEPLEMIASGIKRFAAQKKNLKVVELPELHTGDELELVRNSFSQMMTDITGYVDSLQKVTAEKERIATELNVAKDIQIGMLPQNFNFGKKEFDIYATMNAAKEVGGDFYDCYLLDENHLVMTVADVSGKGIPASLFMVISKTVLKNFAVFMTNPDDFSAVVSCANDQLCEENEEMLFVTVFFGMLELNTGKFVYVNGGHNPPIVYRRKENRCEYLHMERNFVLGAIPGRDFVQQSIQLDPGDLIFAYTDGVNEAMNENNEEYTDKRLLKFMNETDCTVDLPELLSAVKGDVARHVGKAAQSDDMTMMALRRN